MNRVETLLRAEIGLDSASLGPTSVARAAQSRMKTLGLSSVDDYIRLLENSATERAELVESVVVTETWFFRDREAFAAFTEAAQAWLAKNPSDRLRVLSVPCSSGEEPYTLAICLLDAGVPPGRFQIDAVDISARTLERARAGVYTKNAFRGEDIAYRDRHFDQDKNSYMLHPHVRDCVQFQQDNLLNGKFLDGNEPYHFVFCRNVLIYFDRPTQSRTLAKLGEKLARDGMLFAGPAEMSIFLDNGFVSADLPKAFAVVKHQVLSPKPKVQKPKIENREPASGSRVPKNEPQSFGNGLANQPGQRTTGQPDIGPGTSDFGLAKARKLADDGRLAEAAALCEEHLRAHAPTSEAYYLLGLVLDARGEAHAADYYRKALYLEPQHHEALWQLAFLLEKSGELDEASALKRRAERAQKTSATK
jgi:chemotaxis protein methyltransferase WspC